MKKANQVRGNRSQKSHRQQVKTIGHRLALHPVPARLPRLALEVMAKESAKAGLSLDDYLLGAITDKVCRARAEENQKRGVHALAMPAHGRLEDAIRKSVALMDLLCERLQGMMEDLPGKNMGLAAAGITDLAEAAQLGLRKSFDEAWDECRAGLRVEFSLPAKGKGGAQA